MAAELKNRKISSEAYQLMIMGGIFASKAKVELLDGQVVEMSPVENAHKEILARLNQSLANSLDEKSTLLVQRPISLGGYSEPEPDLLICHFQEHLYRNKKAKSEDIRLLIEVSDTTLAKDREVKLPIYAERGIQTFWIVNIPEKQVEVYTEPQGQTYLQTVIVTEQDFLEFSDCKVEISLRELFG